MYLSKKIKTILWFCLFNSCSALAQIDHVHATSELDHYIVQYENKYAVIDNEKNLIIPFDTIRIIDFSDNKVEYKQQNKYFLKNIINGISYGPFDILTYSSESRMYCVVQNEKVGYLNEFGEIVVPLSYERTNSIPERPQDGFIRVKKEGKYGVIRINGEEVIPTKYYYIEYKGHDLFTCKLTPEGHTGLINSKNELVLPPNYAFGAWDFSEGKILTHNFDIKSWGVIDTCGRVIVDFKYDYGTEFIYGVIPMKKNDRWCLIDSHNVMIVKPIYSEINAGINGINGLFSCSLDGKAGVINNKGEEIVPFIYRYCSLYHGTIIIADTNNLYGALDRNGSEVIPCLYDNVSFSENSYKATKGDLCYYFNEAGQQLTKKSYSNDSREIYDNFALVKRKGKYGLIDSDGNEIVKCRFEYVEAITNNPRKFVLARKGKFYVAYLGGIKKLEY